MRKRILFFLIVVSALLLSGCEIRTVDQMYCLPKRPQSYSDLQSVIDEAMTGLDYCAPRNGEHQQTVQMADLDGDGNREYLLFAKSDADKSLHILIFAQQDGKYLLKDTVDCAGSSFERVEYAQLDGKDGRELIVGCQMDGQIPKLVSVYSYGQGVMGSVLTTNYTEFLTCDLDGNQNGELLILSPGTSESTNGVVTLYKLADGAMERSNEVPMSAPANMLKRIIMGNLHGGVPAVFVGSSVEECAIITDIYALSDGVLTNVSLSSESGTSVQTLRNYYVYADDIDSDGEVELPSLIPMKPVGENAVANEQHLIRWYAMALDGLTTDKMFTYHNYVGGWYLELDSQWIHRLSVVQEGSTYSFYLWDENNENAELVFSVYALTGQNREEQAQQENRFVLHKTETTIYAARMEVASGVLRISPEDLINGFHLIRRAWNTGEM